MSARALDALTRLALEQPEVLRLAELLSLATLVDPALLRAARRLNGGGPELEADLFFSALVQDRAATGWTLAPAVTATLRQRLAREPDRLAAAWALTAARHPRLAPALRTEELLQWHALNGDEDAVRDILRGCVAAVTDPARPAFAAWAVDAVGRLDPAMRDLDEFRMLGLGAALRTGADRLVAELADERLEAWLAWLAPPAEATQTVGVVLVEGGVEFGPASDPRYEHAIEVPQRQPGVLTITDEQGRTATASLRLPAHRFVATGTGPVTLKASDGKRWRLSPAQATGDRFRKRRPARVHLEYEVETYGTMARVSLPFVIGVIADLGASDAKPLETRDFLNLDMDNLADQMARWAPRVAFDVPNLLTGDGVLPIDLTFPEMDAFGPSAVVGAVPELAALLEQRQQLNDLLLYLDGKDDAQDAVAALLADRYALSGIAAPERDDLNLDERDEAQRVASLLEATIKTVKPKSAEQEERIRAAIRTTAKLVLDGHEASSGDIFATLDALRQEIDHRLSRQVTPILHHPDFRRLEATWRGLHYLVTNTETSADLKIRVFGARADELHEITGAGAEDWRERPLFQRVYASEFGQLGGQPLGALICDYAFANDADGVAQLRGLARIAAAAHAPLVAAAAPALLGLDAWAELSAPRDLAKLTETADHAEWNAFREDDSSRFVVLTAPRILARQPYGAKTEPVEAFDYEEQRDGDAPHVWMSAAWGLGVRLGAAHAEFGWPARIRGVHSGGTLENLITAVMPTDDGLEEKGPTEIAISDRREAELGRLGLAPLIMRRNSDSATFIGAQTLHRPAVYDSPDATASAAMSARLPYVLIVSRFAHYLMCMARDWVGAPPEAETLRDTLQRWLFDYVDGMPETSSEEAKARRPLKDARVEIVPAPDDPAAFDCRLTIVPQYQMEGMDVALSTTLRLPPDKVI